MADQNKLVKYITETKIFNTFPGDKIDSNCNSITFINTGDMYCVIDSYRLSTGQSLSIQGNFYELNVHQYALKFVKDPLIPGTQVSELTVIRKIYV
jgi:hypothetical protein